MNETIGAKGARNDRKRTLNITKKQKEKLKKNQEAQEIKEIEKEVKKKQKYTLIKTLPIVILGQTYKELTKPQNKKENKFIVIEKEELVKEEIKKEPETKKVIIVLKDGTKKEIEVPIEIKIPEKIYEKEESKKQEEKENKKEEVKPNIKEEQEKEKKEEPVKEEKQESIPMPKEENKNSQDFSDLTEKQREKLQRLQARKIIDVYEKELKNIRYELRNLIIEYNTLIDEEDKIIKLKEEEKVLERLNLIINKIEELKEKIRIDNLNKYDDNYIYTLIEDYLEEFKDKKIIKEIKDSPLYILIEEKLEEFDKKKDIFKKEVEEKQKDLEKKEDKLYDMQEKYSKLKKVNKDINDFYREQEQLLKQMQEKIDNATTITEKVEVQVETMNKGTRRLLRRLSLLMLIPGARGASAFAAMASIYADTIQNILNPKTTTKKVKEITVKDYSADIEKNIKMISGVQEDLYKFNNDLDKLISNIKDEFSDYIGVLPECDELLSNLKEVKSNLKEKEYEIEKIKSKQEKELERNNSKVLSRGTYSM